MTCMNAKPRRIHRRVGWPCQQPCLWCGTAYTPRRAGGRGCYCSHLCRIAAWRAPKTWALVTWSPRGHFEAQFEYFASRWLALAAAPADQPFTVIDAATPVLPHMSIHELIRRTTRPVIQTPYPDTRRGRPLRLAGSGRVLPPDPDAKVGPTPPCAEQHPWRRYHRRPKDDT
jgi:hypothetical protein